MLNSTWAHGKGLGSSSYPGQGSSLALGQDFSPRTSVINFLGVQDDTDEHEELLGFGHRQIHPKRYYWVWRPDPSGGYSVRGAYDLLTFRGGQTVVATTDLIWHKQVPLKVSVAAWGLLRNRLPTKDNLVRRHIISQGAHLCMAGCGQWRSRDPGLGVDPPQYMTTLFSLRILQEALLSAILLCSYCGCVVFG
ncbi:hypothetical protein TSUD_275550 [Trifolium subterraneum]|uniref:Reverse transcriptase zinc-binding domain-containing protein n=1 Tax=Trifolium subterraneum TaxID=3900 RepID=A0A2Z6N5Z4_TRISU|nr:hypothetical protein TSUD_275550 [Trifolium subterraneum]